MDYSALQKGMRLQARGVWLGLTEVARNRFWLSPGGHQRKPCQARATSHHQHA